MEIMNLSGVMLSAAKVTTSAAFILWLFQMRNPGPLQAKKSLKREITEKYAHKNKNYISLICYTDH